MEIRNGDYAIYRGNVLRLVRKANGELRLQAKKDIGIQLGFQEYNHADLKDLSFKSVNQDELEGVFTIYTYAKYKGYTFQVDGIASEGKFRIWPVGKDTFEAFKLNHRDDTTHFWVESDDLEEIWEERQPIKGLPFNTPNKFHIKRKEK